MKIYIKVCKKFNIRVQNVRNHLYRLQQLEDRAVQPPLVQHVIKDGDCETTPIHLAKGGTLTCKLISCRSCTSDQDPEIKDAQLTDLER